MDFGQVGNNAVSACPWCDKLFSVKESGNAGDSMGLLEAQYAHHLAVSAECRAKKEAQPGLAEQFAALRPAFAAMDDARREQIENHPDNGKAGWWRVEGIRHGGVARASSAEEAIRKCIEAGVVGDWELSAAAFFCEQLPDAF